MRFRYARHTPNLDRITKFYTEIIGLSKLGDFQNHSHYDGVFLGFANSDWHLEFTSSNEKPQSYFDEDDALVFYFSSKDELEQKRSFLKRNGINTLKPKNPYWEENGIMIQDPDGYKVIFSVR